MERLQASGPDLNPVYRQRLQTVEVTNVCREILLESRNELFLELRYMDAALSVLKFIPEMGVEAAGTDGTGWYYHPGAVIQMFRTSRIRLNRMFLHSVLHCLFGHPWNRKGRDIRLWNAACDIAAEAMIDELPVRCVRIPPDPYRRNIYRQLGKELKDAGGTLTAGGIYRKLVLWTQEDGPFSDEEALMRLEREFGMDDHRFWNREVKDQPQEDPRKDWDNIRERMQMELETFSSDASPGKRSLTELVKAENHSRYDYREFLKKFSVLKEEMQVDPDSFDYIYYHYGLQTYGNMPLIEPLETREVRKVEDFVIVIDTSMSCSGETVRQFLSETIGLLQESGSFFRKVHIHIIQCDDQIQEDTVITDREEMEQYLRTFEVKGYGGTDFRPAFTYVSELLRRRVFTKLRGLIYFTDGYGIFPVVKPVYETAFVFLKEHYRDVDVPPWAIKLILEPEDLGKRSAGSREDFTNP